MAGGMRGSDPGAGSVGQHLPQRGVRPAAGERLEHTRPLRGTLRRADRGRPTLGLRRCEAGPGARSEAGILTANDGYATFRGVG